MQVIKYLDKSLFPIVDCIDQKIGDGADGEVFTMLNSESLAKFSIFYCWRNENLDEVIASRLQSYAAVRQHSDIFVNVFDSRHLVNGVRKTVDGEQEYAIFYYEMEKLLKISDDEIRVFHSIISHEDSNLKKDLNLDKISKTLDGLSIGLEFNQKKVINFCKSIQNLESLGIHYTDLHPRNVMKSKDGDFKLIDIDRISVL